MINRSVWRTLARTRVWPATGRHRACVATTPPGERHCWLAILRIRAARYAGLDRNPLCRRCDRVEAWLTLTLTAALLVAGPLLAWQTGRRAYDDVVRASTAVCRQCFLADAILDKDALGPPPISQSIPVQLPSVPAHWRSIDGSLRTGEVVPNVPSAAGSSVKVWIDTGGNLIARPPGEADAIDKGLHTGLIVLVGLGCATALVRSAARRLLLHRQMAAWQLEWAVVEPHWSGR